MKKLIFVVIGLFIFTSMAFACVGDECKSDGNVMYSGEGNKGDIFVYDCNKNDKSNTNIGNWVDPSFLKGDKGEQGIQGLTGIGEQGIAGLNGYTPIKGVDYFDGQNGLDFDPAEVIRLDGRIDTETFDRISGDILLQDNINSETTQRINGDKTLNKKINKVNNQSIIRDNQLGKIIDKETSQRKTADIKLDNKITNETQARKTADTKLNNKINTETTDRKQADKVLQKNINTETTQRKQADTQEKIARITGDNKLHNEITTETQDRKTADKVEKTARILGDKKLQNNINVVDTNSKNRDNILQNNIDTETTGRVNGDNFLNNRINDTNIVVDSHSKTLQNHEQRINTLEETQYNVEGVLRILDTKKTTIEIYNTYDTGHSREVAVGVRVTYKLGKSYQDKVNEKTETRLTNLEKQIGNSPIITKVVDTKGNTKSISITANGLSVDGKF